MFKILIIAFSAFAAILGVLRVFLFKENRWVSLAFYLCLFATVVCTFVRGLVEESVIRWLDILLILVFGMGALLDTLFLIQARRSAG